jgi:hypothetical protein
MNKAKKGKRKTAHQKLRPLAVFDTTAHRYSLRAVVSKSMSVRIFSCGRSQVQHTTTHVEKRERSKGNYQLMLRNLIITIMARLKALYHQHRATPDERRTIPKPEAPTGRNSISANTVRMSPFQGLNVCPFTLRRAMPDAIDKKGFQPYLDGYFA